MLKFNNIMNKFCSIFYTLIFVFVCITYTFYSCNSEDQKSDIVNNHQTLENRSLCPSYLEVSGCSNSTSATNVGGTLIFEGCSIPFQVNMRICSWGVYFDPPIINWNAVFSGVWTGQQNSCTDLANKILSLSVQGKTGELNNLLLDIKRQTSLFAQYKSIMFNSLINETFFPCDGNNPPFTYSVVTQETNCTMFCSKIVTGTGIFITELVCGAGCFTRKTSFCVREVGDIEFGLPTFENEVQCINKNIYYFDTTCPEGSTSLGICNAACSKI